MSIFFFLGSSSAIILGSHGQEASRRHATHIVRHVFIGRSFDQVARDLVRDKLIEGHVLVDRVDDPIAISIDELEGPVFIQPIAIGVARDVQPMPTPAFPVLWRGK